MWRLYDEWNNSQQEWLEGTDFVELDMQRVEIETQDMFKRSQDLQKKFKKKEPPIKDDVVESLIEQMIQFKTCW